jgi:hypothetical protein
MATHRPTFSPVNGSVFAASPEVVEVVVGVVLLASLGLLGLLVLLVGDAALGPLGAGVEGELGELPVELVEPLFEPLFEPPFELVGDGLCDELVGRLEGVVHVASGSTYCWLPAEGGHPLWASAAELVVSPNANETRRPMTSRDTRVTTAY